MEKTKEKREKTKDDFSLTAEDFINLGFTRYEAEDEVEFKQTGCYPVYYEREFPLLNRNICASRNLQGRWEISVSSNAGDIMYHVDGEHLIDLEGEFCYREAIFSETFSCLEEFENKIKTIKR